MKRSFGDKSINSLCGWNFRKRPPSLLILGGHLAIIERELLELLDHVPWEIKRYLSIVRLIARNLLIAKNQCL